MNEREIRKTFEEIAKEQGVSVEDVRNEIEKSIAEAEANPDPIKRARFEKIPRKGDKVTPEEFITYMVNIIENIENKEEL